MHTFWPPPVPALQRPELPVCEFAGRQAVVRLPGRYLVADLGSFEDELFAYLMFDYFRGGKTPPGAELAITYLRQNRRLVYRLSLHLPNDLLAAAPALYRLQQDYGFLDPDWRWVHESVLRDMRAHTKTLVAAYNLQAYRPLERLSRAELTAYARRFIRFKSTTDGRVRRELEPGLNALSRQEAQELAEDIVAVTEFFSLPLDFFIGIGAMENNYLNVKGDLKHATWKRRPQRGDRILRRREGWVLVSNESLGVWQITRETLRYVHSLYLADKRDYARLPAHLWPPKEVDLEGRNPRVLTTYAGLLFRHLLDRFHGDVAQAVGAYNGGPGNPNPQYAAGVRHVAEYARRMLERAAVLRGRAVAEMRMPRAGPRRSR